MLQDAQQWPMDFNGLIPLPDAIEPDAAVPGLRLFSSSRALALAGWLGGLEPVRLTIENRQLILEAGQDDRWLVSDLDPSAVSGIEAALSQARDAVRGLQFIAVQANQEAQSFAGFWMMRDVPMP
jgi:hypothetical protein